MLVRLNTGDGGILEVRMYDTGKDIYVYTYNRKKRISKRKFTSLNKAVDYYEKTLAEF